MGERSTPASADQADQGLASAASGVAGPAPLPGKAPAGPHWELDAALANLTPLEPRLAEDEAVDIQVAAETESIWHTLVTYLPSWLGSTVVHLLLVLTLALFTSLAVGRRDAGPSLVVSTLGNAEEPELTEEVSTEALDQPEEFDDLSALSPEPLDDLPPATIELDPAEPVLPGSPDLAAEIDVESLLAGVGGSGLETRLDVDTRHALLIQGGGTQQSEEAVFLALQWLAAHQRYNGSWTFQHHRHPDCHGRCDDPGHTPGTNAATALALLPFLGTGQTHRNGEYKDTIDRGLKYLLRSMKHEKDRGSLWDPDGTMYGHGLASIVLCEAYGMTHDNALRDAAQQAVNFIVWAQHDEGGGWRYHPQTPGDTSVVGWQLMALKSAQMAYLRVPHTTLRRTGYFLDSVAGERGAVYGYTKPEARRPATTAIGLLCRMYLGWTRQTAPLVRGVKGLDKLGPSTDKSDMRNNMYYNYYATQVMHHFGGSPWRRWNAVMRDYLVETQSRQGHEVGSWYFDGADHGSSAGGRLYCTAMAAMILEVYYRHMPLYRERIIQD